MCQCCKMNIIRSELILEQMHEKPNFNYNCHYLKLPQIWTLYQIHLAVPVSNRAQNRVSCYPAHLCQNFVCVLCIMCLTKLIISLLKGKCCFDNSTILFIGKVPRNATLGSSDTKITAKNKKQRMSKR